MSTNAKEAKDKKRLKVFKDLQSSEDAKIKEVKLKYEQNSFKRPSRNNHMTEQLFRDKRDKFKTEYILKTNYIIADRNCSSISDINKLKKITLKEMFVNHIHSNQYLECKTAAVPYYLSGLNLLIQDSNGDMETVILYNFDYNESPSELFPFGTKLIIKEPHFQLIGLDENDFAIRVDSPTDLIITYSNDATSTKKVDELIEIGNKHFTNNQFHVSIRLYTQAIEKSLKTSVRAYLNRSQAYIKLEKYYAANQDAQQAVKLDELNEKAHFRSGKSAYLMRNFKKALESFQTCLKINPKNKEVQIEIGKTTQRIKESTTGEYDFKSIYELFFKGENLYMDIADYWSDKIEVADIKNKSKGVKANALIKKGTLICCNKAASAVFYNKEDYRTKSYTKVDFYENKFSTRNETENISNLIYKMNDNPELAAKIYSLYGGDKFSRDSTPFIDVKRIEAIHEFNSFQIQNSFEALKIIEITNEIAPGYNNDDFKEIDFGSIKFESDLFKKLTELQIKIQNIDKQCGLWYMSAFFNHACISNAIMDFIGDVMTIYAIRDIQKDEEILIRYFPPELNYNQRVQYTSNIYKFTCDCKLCLLDEKDSNRTNRDELLYQILTKNANQNERQISINEMLNDVQKMRSLYSNRVELQLQMITPLELLARKYRKSLEFKKSAQVFEEIFELTKDNNDFISIAVLKEAFLDYKNCSQEKKSESCKQKAYDYFIDIYRFKPCFEELWEKIIFNGFNFVF